jgi:hypothetical protein
LPRSSGAPESAKMDISVHCKSIILFILRAFSKGISILCLPVDFRHELRYFSRSFLAGKISTDQTNHQASRDEHPPNADLFRWFEKSPFRDILLTFVIQIVNLVKCLEGSSLLHR